MMRHGDRDKQQQETTAETRYNKRQLLIQTTNEVSNSTDTEMRVIH